MGNRGGDAHIPFTGSVLGPHADRGDNRSSDAAQRADADAFLGGAGWGYGQCVEADGRYGWDGGLGTGWRTDPATGVSDLLLTQVLWSGPEGPQLLHDFRSAAHR